MTPWLVADGTAFAPTRHMRWCAVLLMCACAPVRLEVRADESTVSAERSPEAAQWVPGQWTRTRTRARWAYRTDSDGRRVRVCVEPARDERAWVSGHWERSISSR